MADVTETIAAIATPAGRGGIGVIRISGPGSLSIAKQISKISPQKRVAHFTEFYDQNNNVIDKGILLCFNKPASYTGEDVAELQGHGGQAVMSLLLERVVELGARLAQPGEFTERAFLNGKLDLIQAEAVADLIDSGSARAARSAMLSLQGQFSSRIYELVEKLIAVRVYIEGTMDFPEEELDLLADGDIKQRLQDCEKELQTILLQSEKGKVLRQGIRTVILGEPNVGKSSLLNRLTQTDRAIVAETPGTTRDLLEDTICLGGITVSLVDTAGVRETQDAIEQEGVNRALSQVPSADVILLVNDVSGEKSGNISVMSQIKDRSEDQKLIIINNKIDLVGGNASISQTEGGETIINLSAKNGEGINLLLEEILLFAGDHAVGDDLLLARERHVVALKKAEGFVAQAIEKLQGQTLLELIAEDLRKAQQALGKITGEVAPDDLLGEIFSHFCIGK